MTRLIKLTRGYSTIVDDDDYDYLMQWKWYAKPDYLTVYAHRSLHWKIGAKKHCRTLRMHRELIGVTGYFVDHINRDGLDNRRENLRLVTSSENMMNRAAKLGRKIKGVYSHGSAFTAEIQLNGVRHYLGYFTTARAAADAYDEAAIRLFGNNALLNSSIRKSHETQRVVEYP